MLEITRNQNVTRLVTGAGLFGLAMLASVALAPSASAQQCTDGAAQNTIQCGDGAAASEPGATAIGDNSAASGIFSTAAGSNSNASGTSSTAVGNAAEATAANSTAIGRNSKATEARATSLGTNAAATASDATALGSFSSASGQGSTAIGELASASGANSTAIGYASVADQDGTVSVGNANVKRRIVNVANGVAANDAVNMGQLSQYQAAVSQTFQTQGSAIASNTTAISLLDSRMTALESLTFDLGSTLRRLDREIDGSTAVAVALSGNTFLPDRAINVTGNIGSYNGAFAGAFQVGAMVAPSVAINAGVATGFNKGGKTAARVGFTFGM